MIKSLRPLNRKVKPSALAAGLCLVVALAQGQAATIDFTRTPENPFGFDIPWSEDGFTLTTITPQTLLNNLSVTTTSSIPAAPPAGLLQFRTRDTSVTAILTNNLQQSFNLFSLDFYSFTTSLSSTNYARVYSSAGGSFDLLGTPNQTTLTFAGSAWENLSYVKVDLISQGNFSPSQLLLDNFVVQLNTVPEPSLFALLGLAVSLAALAHK